MGKTIPEKAAREMDKMLTSVMPDTWAGHGRLVIETADLSAEQEKFASELFSRLVEKYPNVSAEKLAEKAVESAKKKA
jgi:hypothetical protein